MQTPLEVKLREAEARAHVAENVITAAAVLREAGVPGDSPKAHRLFHEIIRLPDHQSMRSHIQANTRLDGIPLREAVSAPAGGGACAELEALGIPTTGGGVRDTPASRVHVSLREARKSYAPAARELLAKEGKARPDGSYPIRDAQDVADAVDDFGHSNGTPEDRAHIIQRAKAVPGGTDNLPADWSGSTHLQESAKRLSSLGIPTLDGGSLGPVRLQESAGLEQLGIPTLNDYPPGSRGIEQLGIPTLDGGSLAPMRLQESTGASQHRGTAPLRHMSFITEPACGTIVRRVA
jgi:hypothetical protein